MGATVAGVAFGLAVVIAIALVIVDILLEGPPR